jgi:hypothetical protein
MGGLVGGIYDLFAGNPTQGEQNTFGALGNEQIGTGEGLVTPAATYYQDILSGDPTKIAQSLAPEISAGQDQVEQQALTGAQFGTRSGGTAAANAAAQGQERGNIINLAGGLQQGAAAGAAGLGESQESQGAGNIGNQANLATAARNRTVGDINGIAGGVASIAAPFLAPSTGGGVPTLDPNAGADPLGLNTPAAPPPSLPGDLISQYQPQDDQSQLDYLSSIQ